jgi:hypothetical protein
VVPAKLKTNRDRIKLVQFWVEPVFYWPKFVTGMKTGFSISHSKFVFYINIGQHIRSSIYI